MKRLLPLFLLSLPLFAQCPTGTLYPGALDTNSSLTVAKNNIVTTLITQQLAGDTVAIVASTTGWVANMMATVDTGTSIEMEFVTGTVGMNTLQVSRACEGTVAVQHLTGVTVANVATAYSGHTSVSGAAIAVETALGANLANVPGTTSGPVVGISKGGSGQTTANAALNAFLGTAGVTGVQGSGDTKVQLAGTNSGSLGATLCNDANGGTTTSGCSSLLPAATGQLQYLRIQPNTGNNTTLQFAALGTANTADFNFAAQTPGGTLTGTVLATVTLTPCPLGVNGADVNHSLYINNGTGSPEAVLLTGGSCTSGLSSGTVQFTPAGNHTGSWTIQSASGGIRECFIAQGTGKACYTPSGTWNFYAPLYDDALVSWFGDGNTSVIQQQYNGDGIIIGPASPVGNVITVANLRAVYGFGVGAFATTGALWKIRNVTDGEMYGLESYLGFEGFQFTASVRVKYSNLYSNAAKYAYHWALSVAGGFPNAGEYSNLYGTIQTNGTAAFLESNIAGLSLANFLFESPGAATGTSGLVLQPSVGNVINELTVANGFVDNFATNAVQTNYQASAAQNQGSTLHFNDIRFTNSSTSASTVANFSAPFTGLVVSNCTFYNGGTGDALTVAGLKQSLFTGNHVIVANAAGRPLVIQAASGAEIVQDVQFTGNEFGLIGATPTNVIVTDGAVHNRIRFTGNKINAGSSFGGFNNTTNTLFDRTNDGLPINAVASAATLAFPPFPDITVTGVTGVTAVSGLTKGETGTLITAAAGFAFTAGATIGNSCTIVTNKLYNWQFDGTKIWLAGNGC